MNKSLRLALIIGGSVITAACLLFAGLLIGRFSLRGFTLTNRGSAVYQMGPGMMGDLYAGDHGYCDPEDTYGPGMMGGYYAPAGPEDCPYYSQQSEVGPGMMWDYQDRETINATPLSLADAKQAVEQYLQGFNDRDLALSEVMIFDNQGYAEIVEQSTGIGAMEVLIDPGTLAVYPEYGPNMMWNLKYGHMGAGMAGMMGGGYALNRSGIDMPVEPEEAAVYAQDYLDRYSPGLQVDQHADVFYGYYTLHTVQNGQVVGMLSVNGYTGDVFMHTWHGKFLDMQEFLED
jgi:hypothetical protein